MDITVLMGGTSPERDVSLASGLRIAEALRSLGHAVTTVDTVFGTLSEEEQLAMRESGVMRALPPDLGALTRLASETLSATVRRLPSRGAADVVFIGLHGGHGEDGTIQALLDLSGLPYTGSGHKASALAMDKDLSKRLFRDAGVHTPDWLMTPATNDEVVTTLGLPVIVKPSKQGSTVGLTLVRNASQIRTAIAEAGQFDDEVMIERYIPGRELTVGILGGDVLPVGEVIPKHEVYDYECKYTVGMAREVFPANITPEQAANVRDQALRAFRALKLSGYARIDFRMATDGRFYCLEANTLPGMTELSLVPQAAAAAGLSFPELCARIVRLALPPQVLGEMQ